MTRPNIWKKFFFAFLLCAETAIVSNAQSFTTLASFDLSDGSFPEASLVQGADGNLYGTTYFGGGNCKSSGGCGTVFKITPHGKLTRLYSFCNLALCADGNDPGASLLLATNGEFYGTTVSGGAANCGTLFKITAAGALATLHTFEISDGCSVTEAVIQAADGNLYGSTAGGGVDGLGGGTVFKITLAGKLTILYSFCSQTDCSDGQDPSTLLQATDGNFYGTTANGGLHQNGENCQFSGCGTVFKITPAGALTTLYRFCSLTNCADGYEPTAALVHASDGNFYGTTPYGGANCSPDGCGTVFRITPAGTLTTLYSFCALANCADGLYPSSLSLATDGKLYGTTTAGCAASVCRDGTVFEITRTGSLTTLHSFCQLTGCTDGSLPSGGLIQATDGIFYGTTELGGASNHGTVFSLATGLGPFVSFVRNPAKVGQQFGILGYGLSGASGVVFNGISARFTAKSDTLLIATVPSGATTGYVTVITAGGTLTSNVPFRVIH